MVPVGWPPLGGQLALAVIVILIDAPPEAATQLPSLGTSTDVPPHMLFE